MPDSARKKILDSALRILLAGVESSAWYKVPATAISELSKRVGELPDEDLAILKDTDASQLEEILSRIVPTSQNSALALVKIDELTRLVKRAIDWNCEGPSVVQRESSRISISHLPVTGGRLIGRTKELSQLSRDWKNDSINVLSIVAWGGVGKSALVNHWLSRLAKDDFRGAKRVFGWSFYRQGLSGDSAASAFEFFDAALSWFGDANPRAGTEWSKGERLAQLIRQEPTLLVLDGLEPLQNPPGLSGGRLRDMAMRSLLRELALENNGLCLVTTRLDIPDIHDLGASTTKSLPLQNLEPADGARLLKDFGLTSPLESDFMDASMEFDGHCLALTLLGSLLVEGYGSDLRKRDIIPGLDGETSEMGGHAKRVMKSYENWFGDSNELDFLKLLSLFDREIDNDAIAALRSSPPIDGLTNRFCATDQQELGRVLNRLRKASLIAERNPHRPNSLDVHPLVRDYFSSKLKLTDPAAWKAGNQKLFQYLRTISPEAPQTVREVSTVCAGVVHGCEAEMFREAFELLFGRLANGSYKRASVTDVLGTHSLNIGALTRFFDKPWTRIVRQISLKDSAQILNHCSFCLKTLGRLRESFEPAEQAMLIYEQLKEWGSATGASSSLLYSMLWSGEVSHALRVAGRGVLLSDKTNNQQSQLKSKTALGDVSHHAGRYLEARSAFESAESQFLDGDGREFEQLISLESFRYCEFLVTVGEAENALERSHESLSVAVKTNARPFEIGLHNLVIGSALISLNRLSECEQYLDKSVELIRDARRNDTLPVALSRRAKARTMRGEYTSSRKDIEESLEIAKRGEMKLHIADALVETARLHGRTNNQEFSASIQKAFELVEQLEYGRKKAELDEISQ